jgi:hypothetical protein
VTRKAERRAKGLKGCGDRTPYKAPKVFSYCPNCRPSQEKYPQTTPHVTNPTNRRNRCSKCGTVWDLVFTGGLGVSLSR